MIVSPFFNAFSSLIASYLYSVTVPALLPAPMLPLLGYLTRNEPSTSPLYLVGLWRADILLGGHVNGRGSLWQPRRIGSATQSIRCKH
ncbi:hypothetical protein HDV57DRAFT_268869 [Trichoderma longibrachiatum]